MKKIIPLVSICCITYNHEKYIRDAIEGFLMQNVTFSIEIIIHDDASTDRTAKIVREYANKYPDLIVPILQAENQYSKGIRPSPTFVWPRARGKYIALCEGDDYWTDPLKIQKQVDFLEKNSEFSICFHEVHINRANKIEEDFITRKVADVTGLKDLIKGNYIHTPSVVFRKNQDILDRFKISNPSLGDYALHMLNASVGKIKKFQDVMAVYRIHEGGIWSLRDKESRLYTGLETRIKVYKYLDDSCCKTLLKRKILKDLFGFTTKMILKNDFAGLEKYETIFSINFPKEFTFYLKYKRSLNNKLLKFLIKRGYFFNQKRNKSLI